MILEQYDTIKITALHKKFMSTTGTGVPAVGDQAAVVEIYSNPSPGFELECCDDDGVTKWLVSMSPSDFEYEKVSR